MTSEGIIASDATKNDFHDRHPHGFSVISVAIAIEDQEQFDEAYFELIREKVAEYGIKVPTPIIKDKYINRYVPLWEQEAARRDIVLDLLSVDALDTIYVTETYLQPTWVELYRDEADAFRREISHEFVTDILFQYYDIISLWKYLNRYDASDLSYTNVMTDDFSGQICRAYEELGELCGQFDAIPYGDVTYPALSMADLVTGLLKQEVYPLRREEIQDFIQDETPAYVETESVHNDDLADIVPHRTDSVRTDLLRPDPTVHIHTGDELPKEQLFTLDVFSYACLYAQQAGGCVKLFDEANDRHHFSDGDLIVCLGAPSDTIEFYEALNAKYGATVLDREQSLEFFQEELDAELLL